MTLIFSEQLDKITWVKGRIRSCWFLRIFTYTDDVLMSAPQLLELGERLLKLNAKKPANADSPLDSITLYKFNI